MAEGQPHIEAAAPAAQSGGIYRLVSVQERLYQGELIENIVEWTPAYGQENRDTVAGAQPLVHTLALILSQDCDLEKDYKKRQQDDWVATDLRSVLLCPAFSAEDLRKQQELTSKKWETVRQNKDDRYAYLAEVGSQSDASGIGHPPILLDLTNYFTVRTTELYRQVRLLETKRRCRLDTPWREHMQLRFASYLSRIGLPRDHFVPEARRLALPAPEQ